MNEIIKIILIFLVIYIITGIFMGGIREGFDANVLKLSNLYNVGEATLSKSVNLQGDSSINSDGSITIKTDKDDILIESGSKSVKIKGNLNIDGHFNVVGRLKVNGNVSLGGDKILLNSDGSARFEGVSIRDKKADDETTPDALKKEYKEPILFGSTYNLKAKQSGAFYDIFASSGKVQGGDPYHSFWIFAPKANKEVR